MRVFDFDGTIYDGDSTVDFYKFCLKNYPRCALKIFGALPFGALMLAGKYDKTKFKQKFYKFLTAVDDVDEALDEFWQTNILKIKPFYTPRESDVIISASPAFLLLPACKRLGIIHLLASEVDKKTGRYSGINCHGSEKVRRLNEYMKDYKIDEFYSDSLSDSPLADIAEKAFFVSGNHISPWPTINKITSRKNTADK